jgi:urease accessory protein
MRNRRTLPNRIALLALSTLPALAQAHPGHGYDAGFAAGALHPFTGLDHLLGIVIAGLLLGALPARLRWPICAAFLIVSGVTHALWLAPADVGGGFVAGLMITSALLIAAGVAATGMAARLTAGTARSPESR